MKKSLNLKPAIKHYRKSIRKLNRTGKLLKKNLTPQKLTPKPVRRLKNTGKIIKSLQKHQDTYLGGLYGILYGVSRFFKKK